MNIGQPLTIREYSPLEIPIPKRANPAREIPVRKESPENVPERTIPIPVKRPEREPELVPA